MCIFRVKKVTHIEQIPAYLTNASVEQTLVTKRFDTFLITDA